MVISNNSFVEFHGKMIWEPQHDHVTPKIMHYNKVCYKGINIWNNSEAGQTAWMSWLSHDHAHTLIALLKKLVHNQLRIQRGSGG